MRFRDIFEGEHEDMAHEVITSHGIHKQERAPDGAHSYYLRDFPNDTEARNAKQGVSDTLRGLGWKMMKGSVGSAAPINYFAHPDEENKIVKVSQHQGGRIIASVNHEDPVIGGMHATVKTLGENEVAVNAAGPGCVDGIGIGPKGEPGYPANKKKRSPTLRGILSAKGMTSDGDGN